MDCRKCYLLCLALVLALSSTIEGLDITNMLSQYPKYALFNKYLTETKLAEQINSRSIVTVLALSDEAMATLNGKSPDAVKAIMSTHVLVNYYDDRKLYEVGATHEKMETLFQSSGAAKNDQGYIYTALINEGETAFRSAATAPDAPYDVLMVRPVTREPETVSIFQVNKAIVAPGIEAVPTLNTNEIGAALNNIAHSPAALNNIAHALSPAASAVAPAPSSSSRIYVTFFAAVSLVASLFMLAF